MAFVARAKSPWLSVGKTAPMTPARRVVRARRAVRHPAQAIDDGKNALAQIRGDDIGVVDGAGDGRRGNAGGARDVPQPDRRTRRRRFVVVLLRSLDARPRQIETLPMNGDQRSVGDAVSPISAMAVPF